MCGKPKNKIKIKYNIIINFSMYIRLNVNYRTYCVPFTILYF